MSRERYAGIWLELSGWTVAAWGDMIGDSHLATRGRRDQAVGRLRQDSALEREQADRQLKDFRHHHRNWFF